MAFKVGKTYIKYKEYHVLGITLQSPSQITTPLKMTGETIAPFLNRLLSLEFLRVRDVGILQKQSVIECNLITWPAHIPNNPDQVEIVSRLVLIDIPDFKDHHLIELESKIVSLSLDWAEACLWHEQQLSKILIK